MQADAALRRAALPGVRETVPGLRSILVLYDPLLTSGHAVEAGITAILATTRDPEAATGRRWTVPVCYGGEHGPDLSDVAALTGLSEERIVARHAARELRVLLIGTFPGMGFLGLGDPALVVPRRPEPRTAIPPSSVAIAGRLTIIYPLSTPGGWNLIGRAPRYRFLDPGRQPPALLSVGDTVRFQPVDPAALARLDAAVQAGDITLEPDP